MIDWFKWGILRNIILGDSCSYFWVLCRRYTIVHLKWWDYLQTKSITNSTFRNSIISSIEIWGFPGNLIIYITLTTDILIILVSELLPPASYICYSFVDSIARYIYDIHDNQTNYIKCIELFPDILYITEIKFTIQ